MEYTQFRNAAYRHLVSCQQLLEAAKNSKTKKDIVDRLCLEIYYLSGYILETMLSYAVCSVMKISSDINESKPFKEDARKFKIHDLKLKYDYALAAGCVGLRGICFFQQQHSDKGIQNLFKEWNVKYRYEKKEKITLDVISKYIESVSEVYKVILTKYPR
ncbi:MAG: hypothetical protein IKP81_00935 [Paludibacteraceae bacterium]|nr:hypothetical protein [Paludibacteraceae bacterium]